MLIRTLTFTLATTFLGLSIAANAHADRVPADSQFITRVLSSQGGSGTTNHYDAVRFEIGFAKPADAVINLLGPLDAPLFGSSQLTTKDTNRRLVATAQNNPHFADFVAALAQPEGRTLSTRATGLADGKPDEFLANFSSYAKGVAGQTDWSQWRVTAIELVIDNIRILPVTFTNGLEGTSLAHTHHVNVYGQAGSAPIHAVPTPSAALAGLALIGFVATRRKRQPTPA
ncbi:MAG: hypothetical protein AAF086_03565 [Planctomycetota bacterium]